jgi:hypothetical protein
MYSPRSGIKAPFYPPEIFGGLRLNSCVADLLKMCAHPPKYAGGLRFFIGLGLALEPDLGL